MLVVMKNDFAILLTKSLLFLGVMAGGTGELLDQFDLILGIILKIISIISFAMVIAINWQKFIRTVKTWLR